jgi:hypothetical protein
MKQILKRHGVGALVTCTFVVLVMMGTARGFLPSGQRAVSYVDCPFQTVTAGVQDVRPGGEVVITGACPEALTIDKPLTLKAQGSGAALIGPHTAGDTPAPPLPDGPLINHLIAEWSDPLTLPQCRIDGWDITCRHMINRWYIRIDGDTAVDAQGVRQCFQEALISGAVAAIAAAVWTGGAAWPAATEAFIRSMAWCIESDFLGISFPTWSGWSD